MPLPQLLVARKSKEFINVKRGTYYYFLQVIEDGLDIKPPVSKKMARVGLGSESKPPGAAISHAHSLTH